MLFSAISLVAIGIVFLFISLDQQNAVESIKIPHMANDFIANSQDTMEILKSVQTSHIRPDEASGLINQISELKKLAKINRRLILQHIREKRAVHNAQKKNVPPYIGGAGTIGLISNSIRVVDLNRLQDFERAEISPLKEAKDKVDELLLEIDITLFGLERVVRRILPHPHPSKRLSIETDRSS